MRGAAFAIVLVLSGCGEDAICEIEIDLPVQPDGDPQLWNTFVQVAGDGVPMGGEAIGPRPLGPVRRSLCASVVTQDTSIDELVARVRFCRGDTLADCDEAEPELRLIAEAPFYAGRRTYLRATLDVFPPMDGLEERRLARCDVQGCSQDVATTGYCVDGDGPHLCELDRNVELPPLCD